MLSMESDFSNLFCDGYLPFPFRYYALYNSSTQAQTTALYSKSTRTATLRVWIVDPLNLDSGETAQTALVPSTVNMDLAL